MADSHERYREALRLFQGMERRGIASALVGGLAVGARAVARTTKDIDFAVATASDADAERVVREVAGLGLVPRVLLEQTGTGRLATVRFAYANDRERSPVVDILFASCGIEPEIVDGAEPTPLPDGQEMNIASLAHLVAMKALSESDARLQDRTDMQLLLLRATAREIKRASAALELITARGYARDKDLKAVLRAVLADIGRADVLP